MPGIFDVTFLQANTIMTQKSSCDCSYEDLVADSVTKHGQDKINWLMSLTNDQLIEYVSLYGEFHISRLNNCKKVNFTQPYWVTVMLTGVWYYRSSKTLREGLIGVTLAACTYRAFAERIFQFMPRQTL